MSAHDAAQILSNYCHKKPYVDYQYLTASYKSMTEHTHSYVGEIRCEMHGDNGQRDELTIDMSPQTAGNVVQRIERKVYYTTPDNSPQYDTLSSDLTGKYGIQLSSQGNSYDDVIYTTKDSQIVDSKSRFSMCPFISNYASNTDANIALCSSVNRYNANPSRVSYFVISLEDLSLKITQQQEALKQIDADIDRKLSSDNVKPNL